MFVKLKADLDPAARRILDNAERVARRCAAWPAWKRNEPESTTEEVCNAPRCR